MLLDTCKPVFAALFFLPVIATATTVNRCEDEHGSITFTTLACPMGHALKPQNVHSPLPGTVVTTSAPTEIRTRKKTEELVVVGQRDDGCGNVLNAEQRRRAIINQQTPAGMTKRDVESLLGKPDKIVGRNAELRYVYEEKKGKSRQVTFDEKGCVKGKR
ncbi:hypothetical protein [Pseudomonas abietaniphila]|uniref:hypothetical protein n=1 Tax=Pseudomonas abietaniphila TaxID=89065 RepID=UPI000784E81E|nr:hypothetical protein [Pseudomonas abietaniphila]